MRLINFTLHSITEKSLVTLWHMKPREKNTKIKWIGYHPSHPQVGVMRV